MYCTALDFYNTAIVETYVLEHAVSQLLFLTVLKLIGLRKSDGDYLIYKNTTGGHFMHSESTVIMYQSLLRRIYDMRRARYGLHGRKGLLVADAFTGNFARKEGDLTAFTYLASTVPSIYLFLLCTL